MGKIAVSGASGDLGRRITAALLERVPSSDLTLVSRTPDKLAARGVEGARLAYGDYRDLDALVEAYRSAETLMMISSIDVTHRVPEHRNAIEAARRAGVRHIVYTSNPGMHRKNPTLSASDHIVTEDDLRRSGLAYTIMRNQTYAEVFPTLVAKLALESGKLVHAAGNGMLSPVSKRDIAQCAAVCLTDPEWHADATYEITGPDMVNFHDIAALISEFYGKCVEYVPVSYEERYRALDAMGVPRTFSDDMAKHEYSQQWSGDEMVSSDRGFAENFHAILSRHVEMITGTPPLSLRDVFALEKDRTYGAG